MTRTTKSKRHVAFAGDYEYFKAAGDNIYRANRSNPIASDGQRSGSRFECTGANWKYWKTMRLKAAREQAK